MDYVKMIGEIRADVLLGLGVLFLCASYWIFRKPQHKLPPGPWGLPFLGYLPFMMKDQHLVLTELRKKYGDIFGLNMAGTYLVVVSDYALTKELFNKNAVLDRPSHVFRAMPGGVGFAEFNGDKWVDQRKFTVTRMKNLGLGKSAWERTVQTEVNDFLNWLSRKEGHPVDISFELSTSLSNNLLSLATGHHLSMDDPRRGIIESGVDSFQQLNEQSGLAVYMPNVFWAAVRLGLVRVRERLKHIIAMNSYVKTLIEELKKEDYGHSYIHGYLKEIEDQKETNSQNFFNEANLTGNVQALIIAGSDTTTVSLQWLMLAMAAHPHIQDKLHAEIDAVLGKERFAVWEERTTLPYCYATVLEGQRWRTVVPLNVLRRASEDIKIREYVIPKDSDIISFLWAFHTDPQHWKNPDEFRPERWLAEDEKTVKKLENYAPFSIGKRMCMGETVAYIEIFLYFVHVLQRFRILPEDDGRPLNLKGTLGLTYKPERQRLRYVPR